MSGLGEPVAGTGDFLGRASGDDAFGAQAAHRRDGVRSVDGVAERGVGSVALQPATALEAAAREETLVTLRDYQIGPVEALCSSKRGIVKAPAGSGKTIIGAAAIARAIEKGKVKARLDRRLWLKPRVVWLANTREQCDQAEAALARYDLRARAHVTVACYAGADEALVEQCDLLVVDECHHAGAPELASLVAKAPKARWGLSATPTRADDNARVVFDLLGPIVAEVKREGLVEAGQLAQARVVFHAPNDRDEMVREIAAQAEPLIQQRKRYWRGVSEEDIRKRTLWAACQEIGLFENAKRNRAAIEIARAHAADSTIMLVGKIEHGEMLAERIPGAVVVFSRMGAKRRQAAMDAFRADDLKCMIATSLADEGMDLPRASVMIMVVGGRSSTKAEQRTGRVLRAWGDKTHGTIHEFFDRQHYFLKAQSVARMRLYRSLGYSIEGVTQ